MTGRSIRYTLLAAVPLLACWTAARAGAEDKTAAPAPPDRREIWVPTDRLNEVLKKNPKAVLLSREQYETLLRDAGRKAKAPPELPREVAFTTANYHAHVDGRVLRVQAEFSVQVLSEGWTQMPLAMSGLSLATFQVDGDAALAPPTLDPPAKPSGRAHESDEPAKTARLFLRGRGEHKITVELTTPIAVEGGRSRAELQLPPAGSGAFQLELPPHTQVVTSQPARVESLPAMTRVTAAIVPSSPSLAFVWHAAADPASSLPARAQMSIGYAIDGDKLRIDCAVTLSTSLGTLPAQVQITVPKDCTVLEVLGEDVASWTADAGRIKIDLHAAERTTAAFHFALQQPSLGGAAQATRDLPAPKLEGIGEVSGEIALHADPGVEIKEIAMDPTARPFASNPGTVGAWEFTNAPPAGRVTIERLLPRFSADLDTVVEFKLDAVYLERTITLHEERGDMFHLQAAVPPGEEVLSVQTGGHDADWRMEGGQLLLRWSDAAAPGKPRAFIIRTRTEPQGWTQPAPEGILFTLTDTRIEGAENVSGYIALRADESFRLEAQPSDTLERRDARTTPVQGEYAWFRREAFALQVKVMRRPSEVLAALTGYALPLEGMLDLHAQIAWEFKHSGVRSVRVRVPAALATQFHFDGPQIAERSLIDDTWRITFQKELTGAYALEVTAQLPIARDAADPTRFKVQIPVVEPLGAQRTGGVWSVEANTETEITIDSKGMNELDALSAPPLPGYAPRHRVIGVFSWIGGDYTLGLSGVRHAPARVLTTIVDAMAVDSVLSTSGAIRTQAALTLRNAGAQFLNLTLPSGARLLSLTVDNIPLKPVEGAPDEVRVELPAKGDPSTAIPVVVLYETSIGEWSAGGQIEVPAPRLPAEVPVLQSTWHLYLPDGFRYADFQSNLRTPNEVPEQLLVQRPADLWSLWSAFFAQNASKYQIRAMASGGTTLDGEPQSATQQKAEVAYRGRPTSDYTFGAPQATTAQPLAWSSQPGMVRPPELSAIAPPEQTAGPAPSDVEKKLDNIMIPKLELREATLLEALDFLEKKSVELDTAEPNPARRGIKIRQPANELGAANITISLSKIPLREALRYITSLSNMQFKVQSGEVLVTPLSAATEALQTAEIALTPDFFSRLEKSGSAASASNGRPARTDIQDLLAAQGVVFPPGSSAVYLASSPNMIVKNTRENLDRIKALMMPAGMASNGALSDSRSTAVKGLIPIKLELPKAGSEIILEGLIAPDGVTFHYDDWWGRARRLWWCIVGGGLAFFLTGQRRPWWKALWAILLLSAIPLCIGAELTAACNALLMGWLLALLLARIAVRLAFGRRAREEAIAS